MSFFALQRGRRSSRRRSFAREAAAACSAELQRGRRSSRRRSRLQRRGDGPAQRASTRPPFFTAEVQRRLVDGSDAAEASTRPPFFTAEVGLFGAELPFKFGASTRPPFFTAEVTLMLAFSLMARLRFNEAAVLHGGGPRGRRPLDVPRRASTRPPFFTAEVFTYATASRGASSLQRGRRSSRRRSQTLGRTGAADSLASTRPPFFTAEVLALACRYGGSFRGFNEAAVLHGGGLLGVRLGRFRGVGLQRGRRSSRRRSELDVVASRAAIKPQRGRHSSRRRSTNAVPSTSPCSSLQRGRRSSRRRSSKVNDEARRAQVLQRGRRSSRRRSLATLATKPPAKVASTRPPFFTAEVPARRGG